MDYQADVRNCSFTKISIFQIYFVVNTWPSHKSSEKRRFEEINLEIYLHILGLEDEIWRLGGGRREGGGGWREAAWSYDSRHPVWLPSLPLQPLPIQIPR